MDYAFDSGRVLRISWQPANGQRLAVVAVYAPHVAANRYNRPAFFAPEGVLQEALPPPPRPVDAVFLAGDFNCVMRPEDVWGGAPRVGNRGEGAADGWGLCSGGSGGCAAAALPFLSLLLLLCCTETALFSETGA
jgi:hypothetical protein